MGQTTVQINTNSSDVHLRNDLQAGAIGACIYKNGQLLAIKTSIATGQKAAFQFKPTILIGAISQVAQGEEMNSAIIQSVKTEISLLGIASEDVVMTGGGSGAASTAFEFKLENVVMA